MQVKDLKARAPVEEITLKLESINEPRQVRDGALTVANATGVDETGSVVITLWNDEVNKVKTGDTVKITKGWVNEYQGNLQLSAGKFGSLDVVESAKEDAAPKKEANKDVDYAIDEDII